LIPYGRQSIDETDIAAVIDVLRSDWLTTGPKIEEFETAFAEAVGAQHAVAVNSGTAALHAAMHVHGIGPGDEVIVPANTFAASSNAVLYCGATPVFADIQPQSLLIDPNDVSAKITDRTRGVITVDFAGMPCDYNELEAITSQHGLFLHADACHALGASYRNRPVGSLAKTSSFSFHPVKPITTGEGGMITTNDPHLAAKMRIFRNHGITTDFRQRQAGNTWQYDMVELGYNYRLSDIQCALGQSQLRRLEQFVADRTAVAEYYRNHLEHPLIEHPPMLEDRTHAYHLYPIRLRTPAEQGAVFRRCRARGVGIHVMYRPVYAHPYYRDALHYPQDSCPQAESAYASMIVLPVFAGMTPVQADEVISVLKGSLDESHSI